MRRQDLIWWLLLAVALALGVAGDWRYIHAQIGLIGGAPFWWGGVAVVGVAAWWGDRGVEASRGKPWTRNEVLALLAIGAVAVLYHLWRITEYPPPDAFGFEEYQTGGLAYHVYTDWAWPLEFPLTNLLPGVSFRLFGLSSYSLRAPFVLSGIVAPVLLFVALRRVVALPAAWTAAMLLATNRWATAAARYADEILFPISVAALILWLLVRVIQQRRLGTAFVLGLATSDFFYAYTGYRVFPFIVFGGTLAVALVRWRRNELPRGAVRCFVLVAVVWAILLGPGLMQTRFSDASVFFEALQRHAQGWREVDPAQGSLFLRAQGAAQRFRQGWRLFAVEGDAEAWVNVPFDPMFDPLTAALGTVAVVWAFVRWRDPWRLLTLAAFLVPFGLLAVVPTNFAVQRYFVLLIPLFALIAFLADDLLHWRVVPQIAGGALLVIVAAVVAVLNFRQLQRLIDNPIVQTTFVMGENTVLAAVHAVPAGGRAVMLTSDGSNALEPSDYRFLTAHITGGRPPSLADALALPPDEDRPVYWITQGPAEIEAVPHLVALVCPQAQSKVVHVEKPLAAVGITWVDSRAGCHAPPPMGLSAAYVTVDANGTTKETRQIDPALIAYTVPWELDWHLQIGAVRTLDARWEGSVIPRVPGQYQFRLEVLGGTGALHVGDVEAGVSATPDAWQSARLQVAMGGTPLAVRVTLHGDAGASPRVRLHWSPPGEPERIIPPQQLRPAG